MPRSVIVTGAGSGIGAGVARAFAEAGDRVYLADLSPDRLAEQAAAFGSDLTRTVTLDVTDFAAFSRLVAEVTDATGRVDVLVNCAGVADGAASILETSPELWNRVIGINLTGCFHGARAVSEQMVTQRSGRIINIGSICATRALASGPAYDASKAGIEGLTRRLAVDLGPHGVTANVVAPGSIATSIQATTKEILGDLVDVGRAFSANPTLLETFVPAKRRGTVEELAAAVLFLADDRASYVNGTVLRVDGGWASV